MVECMWFCFETGPRHVAKAGLKFLCSQGWPQPSICRECRHAPPCQAAECLHTKSADSNSRGTVDPGNSLCPPDTGPNQLLFQRTVRSFCWFEERQAGLEMLLSCLGCMKAWVQSPALHKLAEVRQACNSST